MAGLSAGPQSAPLITTAKLNDVEPFSEAEKLWFLEEMMRSGASESEVSRPGKHVS
jgi:hypothetical protein